MSDLDSLVSAAERNAQQMAGMHGLDSRHILLIRSVTMLVRMWRESRTTISVPNHPADTTTVSNGQATIFSPGD